MKKVICILLAISILFIIGYTKGEPEVKDTLLGDYLNRVESFDSVVHQYGEEESRVLFGEKMVATVLYPETGLEELDIAVKKYIDETIATSQVESADEDLLEPAELLISYNSFLSKTGIVSIELIGTYFNSSLAHPMDIVKTFVADTATGKLMKIDEVLKSGKRAEIENRLIEEFEIDRERNTEDLLEWWVIAENRLKIILPKGEFLAMSEGTKYFTFTKGETVELLKNGNDESVAVNQNQDKDAATDKTEQTDIDITKPMIALTFDDGPSVHTQRLLDIFKKYGGKGTFFVIGNSLDNRQEALKRIAAEGHEIGNHSWSHRKFTTISIGEVKDQIMMTRAKIFDITGVDCTIVRPPYGLCDDEIKALGKELGVSFINWSVDTLDWKSKNADAVYNEIMKYAANGHIILCHDLYKSTIDAMEKAIPALIEKGYQLVTVSELLTCRGGEMAVGKLYYKQNNN